MEKFNRSEVCSVDVDAQKGFTPICPDELPVPEGDQIVEELNKQAKYASIRVGSKDAHPSHAIWMAYPPQRPQFEPIKGKNVDVRWNKHCVIGTKGFELLDGLPHPIDYDYFVWKGIECDLHPYSACYHGLNRTLTTGVIEFLKSKNIKLIVCGGLATDYCVAFTAIDLKEAGFDVIINLGASRAIGDPAKYIEKMKILGIKFVNSSEELGDIVEK